MPLGLICGRRDGRTGNPQKGHLHTILEPREGEWIKFREDTGMRCQCKEKMGIVVISRGIYDQFSSSLE